MHFDKNILQGQCEKENKKGKGLQILHFYWTFALTFFAAVYLNVGEWGWGIEGKQVGSMDEESQVRGCYN